MVIVRKWGKEHINNSLKQIDSNTWLIGRLLLHRSPYPSDTATWNDDGDNSSYLLTEAPSSLPPAITPPNSPHIKLVHEAGDASAVWSIGQNAFCKVRYIEGGVTPESITLKFVQDQKPSFKTPEVLHHAFDHYRSYLFLQRVPGRTLDAAWPSLDERWRRHYVGTVVSACKEMTEWKGRGFGGVDGKNIPEYYLIGPQAPEDFKSANLQAACKRLGMDCSSFVFYHADLGPTNIIVENVPISGEIGIIDFEIAGFFPRSWIRTKFRLSSGMDLSPSASGDPYWWRREVQKALGASGFDDVRVAWEEWQEYKPSLAQLKN
jgi:hypothetical protein